MSEDLFPEKPQPDWVVLPIYRRQTREEMVKKKPLELKHYELLYRGKMHLKRKGEHGHRILKEMAAFMNHHGMPPRAKVECLAAAGLPPLKKKTPDGKTQGAAEEAGGEVVYQEGAEP